MKQMILFAGRTRANCSMCFFQRRYEFLWLYETHPDLFAQAEALEKPGEYSFQKGFFLSELRDEKRRNTIFDNRVDEVVRTISARMQGSLFNEPRDNELALISCGLLCGK